MYKLVHTHTKIKIAHDFVMQHIFSVFLRNIKHVLSQKRDIIIHVILKKNKTRSKIKYFCLLENFQCFWIFFFNNQNNQKNNNNKHVLK